MTTQYLKALIFLLIIGFNGPENHAAAQINIKYLKSKSKDTVLLKKILLNNAGLREAYKSVLICRCLDAHLREIKMDTACEIPELTFREIFYSSTLSLLDYGVLADNVNTYYQEVIEKGITSLREKKENGLTYIRTLFWCDELAKKNSARYLNILFRKNSIKKIIPFIFQ